MRIEADDPERADVLALLEEHLSDMYAQSPPGSVHALDPGALKQPGLSFWSARDENGRLLGCAALKQLDPGHAEVKSMRTPRALRRQGAGRALLRHIIAEARARACRRLSLETGSMPAFEPARRLYASAGFIPCAPFGGYPEDPNSCFMTLDLAAPAAGLRIRPAQPEDAVQISEIYNHYILATTVSFEEEPVTPAVMQARIEARAGVYPWLVGELDGRLVGYAYASRWKERAAYRHAVETSIYLRVGSGGRGFGKTLYAALLEALEGLGIHAVIGGVALPNEASVRLHEAMGFTRVAHFSQVGQKFGQWLDVAYWQRLLPGA